MKPVGPENSEIFFSCARAGTSMSTKVAAVKNSSSLGYKNCAHSSPVTWDLISKSLIATLEQVSSPAWKSTSHAAVSYPSFSSDITYSEYLFLIQAGLGAPFLLPWQALLTY